MLWLYCICTTAVKNARLGSFAVYLLGVVVRVMKASPFFMLFVYRALEKHGDAALVLRMIRQRYGSMLDARATTLWENWQLFYKSATGGVKFQSASHAWAAMPLVFAAEQLLGINIAEAGFTKVIIAPKLFDLDYAEGTVVTPGGEYGVAVIRESGGIRVKATVPAGCEAWIGGELHREGTHHVLLPDAK
ncbi:alpha-L-rhamnosidase C-terminal domain-containing protein [Paenibacillus allorhizosphaerae]|uniref:Alpha-L-rhamnosidase C-terminal domain-containing protein n=1 Tax=Paenibacillus allorhizosphaerae TaxID=2849866 RepID=A0ABM8VUZ3_9BACL|nr:alpha-L-rhamnosidase C-terminal domain-containing protein [Paenibacillus allorhizosphaerae]CAG7659086.1 hypothetical protein PAECIP111802_07357 [Paenibacillus allorhizosphaerae]